MTASGLGYDLYQQINYVLAVCYGLVGQDKGLQNIYRDAYLGRGRTDPRPPASRMRIGCVFTASLRHATDPRSTRNSTECSAGSGHRIELCHCSRKLSCAGSTAV